MTASDYMERDSKSPAYAPRLLKVEEFTNELHSPTQSYAIGLAPRARYFLPIGPALGDSRWQL